MTGYTAIRLRTESGVVWVTIDSPPLNILDATLMTDLDRFAAAVALDPEVRVVVFQSADPDFFVAHGDMGSSTTPPPSAASRSATAATPVSTR